MNIRPWLPKFWMMSSHVRPLQVGAHGGGHVHAHPEQSQRVPCVPLMGNFSSRMAHENWPPNGTPLYMWPVWPAP